MNYIHFSHCFLFLMLYRGLHNFSVCVHMLIWLACTHTHMQAGVHVCQTSPFDVAPPGAVHFVLELASLTGHRDEAGLAGQPTPGLYCFCHKYQHHIPFSFHLLCSVCWFWGWISNPHACAASSLPTELFPQLPMAGVSVTLSYLIMMNKDIYSLITFTFCISSKRLIQGHTGPFLCFFFFHVALLDIGVNIISLHRSILRKL